MTTGAATIAEGPDLVIEFVGDERVLTPGEELTFGRSADLVVDDNRYLHRVLGRFAWANGMWWLSNVGSAIPLAMADSESPSFVRVSPGATVPIPFASATLGFEAGGRSYELRVEVLSEQPGLGFDPSSVEHHPGVVGAGAELTTTASSLPLTDEQRLLLVALAEPRLRDVPGSEQLPTNRQIAHMFGWTITKYNRKLDGLCKKFAAAGVGGLRGTSDLLARDRRVRLTDHVVHAGVISAADLPLLDAARHP